VVGTAEKGRLRFGVPIAVYTDKEKKTICAAQGRLDHTKRSSSDILGHHHNLTDHCNKQIARSSSADTHVSDVVLTTFRTVSVIEVAQPHLMLATNSVTRK
jgi:hypothetical protein